MALAHDLDRLNCSLISETVQESKQVSSGTSRGHVCKLNEGKHYYHECGIVSFSGVAKQSMTCRDGLVGRDGEQPHHDNHPACLDEAGDMGQVCFHRELFMSCINSLNPLN